ARPIGHDRISAGRDEESARRQRPSGKLLVASYQLTADHHKVLDVVVERLLEQHGGDIRRCLDALAGFGPLKRQLERRMSRGPTPSSMSTNPTIQSMPIDRGEEALEPGLDSELALGDWSISADLSSPPALDDAKHPVEWFLGTTSSSGMRFQI